MTVGMLALALRLPMARAQRLTQVLGEMHQVDQSKTKGIKGLAMAISTTSSVV